MQNINIRSKVIKFLNKISIFIDNYNIQCKGRWLNHCKQLSEKNVMHIKGSIILETKYCLLICRLLGQKSIYQRLPRTVGYSGMIEITSNKIK